MFCSKMIPDDTEQQSSHSTHNPKVVGSSPTPATKKRIIPFGALRPQAVFLYPAVVHTCPVVDSSKDPTYTDLNSISISAPWNDALSARTLQGKRTVAMSSMRKRFGVFMAPFHRLGENPTLALERDIELIQWLDKLGYDEAWIGEHHSAGWETIASPEVFIATVAERTRHIALGTGVISLPYHHPLMVANRMTLLDHLTRGRVMLGVGPGALVSDAHILGLDHERQREMMDESLGTILRLFTETEPFTLKTDWFELNDAVMQLRPFQQPHMPVAVAAAQSPAGAQVAGKHGAAMLTATVPRQEFGPVTANDIWAIAEESAAEVGKEMRREDWRLVIPIYLADSRQEAIADAGQGGSDWMYEYFQYTLGQSLPYDGPRDGLAEFLAERGAWIIGTPDDCIERLEQIDERVGGFGGVLLTVIEWASREKVLNSYELLARHVMPHFQGSLTGLEISRDWSHDHIDDLQAMRRGAILRAKQRYEDKREAASPR